MSAPIDLRNPDRTIHVGVVIVNSTTEILDVAPVDYIYGMSTDFLGILPDEFVTKEVKEQALKMQFHWITETGAPGSARLTSGITLVPTDSYESCPPLDIVLYGAHHSGYNLTEAELAFARKAYESCAAFISICGGIEIPLRAGITKGKKATGPRFMLEQYRQWEPETEWLEKRWVHDGKLWTSGALTNGQDLMHAFTHELWGDRINPAVKMLSVLGCWINRDVDYKDEPLIKGISVPSYRETM